jgi:hypothetical protein
VRGVEDGEVVERIERAFRLRSSIVRMSGAHMLVYGCVNAFVFNVYVYAFQNVMCVIE